MSNEKYNTLGDNPELRPVIFPDVKLVLDKKGGWVFGNDPEWEKLSEEEKAGEYNTPEINEINRRAEEMFKDSESDPG